MKTAKLRPLLVSVAALALSMLEGAVSAGERARLLDLLKAQVESAKP